MARPRRSGSFWEAVRHAFAIPEEKELNERQREWLDKLARKVVERGVATPALFFLECSRPVNYLGAHAVLFFKPFISMLFEPEVCDQVVDLLSKRGAIGTLVDMIESYEAAEQSGPSASGGEDDASGA